MTPIQTFFGLLNGMLTKGKVEKQEEMQRFTESQHRCGSRQFETNRNIKVAADTFVLLQAEIERHLLTKRDLVTASKNLTVVLTPGGLKWTRPRQNDTC